MKNGTRNLDMVTNGLESYISGSSKSVGRFAGTLINGKQLSFKDLLNETAAGSDLDYEVGQDPLRVVDGELDNKYKSSTKITITPK